MLAQDHCYGFPEVKKRRTTFSLRLQLKIKLCAKHFAEHSEINKNYPLFGLKVYRGYYTEARRCEFCVRVARTISHDTIRTTRT